MLSENLQIHSSGTTATDDVVKEVLKAELIGKETKQDFISNRLAQGEYLFQPIKRRNLKKLGNLNNMAKVTTSQNQMMQFKYQRDMTFHFLTKCLRNEKLNIDLDEPLNVSLNPVPYSFSTANGILLKRTKPKQCNLLLKIFQMLFNFPY